MTSMTCPVEGCIKDVSRGGYCYAHYMKNWRYGTPTPVHEPQWEDLTGGRFGSLVAVERLEDGRWKCDCDCGANTIARVGDLNRGSKVSCGDRAKHRRDAVVTYHTAHRRLDSDLGRAKTHQCVDCGSAAQQWSYDHLDPDELFEDVGSKSLVAYSLKPEHYSPRCISCHKKFDLGRVHATPQ